MSSSLKKRLRKDLTCPHCSHIIDSLQDMKRSGTMRKSEFNCPSCEKPVELSLRFPKLMICSLFTMAIAVALLFFIDSSALIEIVIKVINISAVVVLLYASMQLTLVNNSAKKNTTRKAISSIDSVI